MSSPVSVGRRLNRYRRAILKTQVSKHARKTRHTIKMEAKASRRQAMAARRKALAALKAAQPGPEVGTSPA